MSPVLVTTILGVRILPLSRASLVHACSINPSLGFMGRGVLKRGKEVRIWVIYIVM